VALIRQGDAPEPSWLQLVAMVVADRECDQALCQSRVENFTSYSDAAYRPWQGQGVFLAGRPSGTAPLRMAVWLNWSCPALDRTRNRPHALRA